ncbi:hypothetical protein ACFQ0T_16420 [Kitasatospora gansuensis]
MAPASEGRSSRPGASGPSELTVSRRSSRGRAVASVVSGSPASAGQAAGARCSRSRKAPAAGTAPAGWYRIAQGLQLTPGLLDQRQFGDLALLAEPPLDLVEPEGGAAVTAAGRAREVGVAAAPVADGGPADPRQSGDLDGGHLGAVRHLGLLQGGV